VRKGVPTESSNFGNDRWNLKKMAQAFESVGCRAPARAAHNCTADEGMLEPQLVYLLVDKPEVYGLPPDPKIPSRNLKSSAVWSVLGGRGHRAHELVNFRNRGVAMSSTFFTASPQWRWLIVAYFFLAGLARAATSSRR